MPSDIIKWGTKIMPSKIKEKWGFKDLIIKPSKLSDNRFIRMAIEVRNFVKKRWLVKQKDLKGKLNCYNKKFKQKGKI